VSRRYGWRGFLLTLPLLAVVAYGFTWLQQWIEAPWSLGGPGQPTLTGTWEGPLRARQGSQYRLFVDVRDDERRLNRSRSRGTRNRADLVGFGRICAPTGTLYEYTVIGGANRSADEVRIELEYPDPKLSALGIDFEGGWHGETLALRALSNPFDPAGTFTPNRSWSSADPPDDIAPTDLRRATLADFEAACRQLPPPRR
jgi:hypothetical protein